ncbi:MAG: hypothetical protein DMG11_19685 [Acidobacteria bacterium]|nr:MAG: hypothetical protein DMG11_19685 [Acidobacteriota bacterium]
MWIALLVMAVLSAPASAQILLSGNWMSVRTHEDEQDRGPGPDLGDYLGIPINRACIQPRSGDRV